jgi:hypothetical protein
MGSCVSSNNTDSQSQTMKFKSLFASKPNKVLIPSPPLKDKPFLPNGNNPVSDFGSKDETFFDSKGWLDSDCESDFQSVNGEFTPSRGSTPVHHKFSTGSPKVNKPGQTPNLEDKPSPTDSKKKLSDLFRDSLRSDPEVIDPTRFIDQKSGSDPTMVDTPGTESIYSSEISPAKYHKVKSVRSGQCCLPGLLSSHSFTDRKKKMGSPMASVG